MLGVWLTRIPTERREYLMSFLPPFPNWAWGNTMPGGPDPPDPPTDPKPPPEDPPNDG